MCKVNKQIFIENKAPNSPIGKCHPKSTWCDCFCFILDHHNQDSNPDEDGNQDPGCNNEDEDPGCSDKDQDPGCGDEDDMWTQEWEWDMRMRRTWERGM